MSEQIAYTRTGEYTRRGTVRRLLSFPDPVNEVSARLVAAGVVIMCLLTIGLNIRWATAVIAYGFVARALTGPKLSPLGQLVTRVLTPRLPFAPRARARASEALRTGHRSRLLSERPGSRCRRQLGSGPSGPRLVGQRCLPRVRFRVLPGLQGICTSNAPRRRPR